MDTPQFAVLCIFISCDSVIVSIYCKCFLVTLKVSIEGDKESGILWRRQVLLFYGAPLQSVELALFPPFPYRELIQKRERHPQNPSARTTPSDGACMLACYSQRADQVLLLPLWCSLGGHICLDPGDRKSGSGYTAGTVQRQAPLSTGGSGTFSGSAFPCSHPSMSQPGFWVSPILLLVTISTGESKIRHRIPASSSGCVR